MRKWTIILALLLAPAIALAQNIWERIALPDGSVVQINNEPGPGDANDGIVKLARNINRAAQSIADIQAGSVVYLSATGSDANDGLTAETAWRNISKLDTALATPGNTISLVRFVSAAGTIHCDAPLIVHPNANGGNGIVLASDSPTVKVGLDWSISLANAAWTLVGGTANVYQTQLPTANNRHKNCRVWEVVGGDAFNKKPYNCGGGAGGGAGGANIAAVKSNLDSTAASSWIDNATGILYVHYSAGGDPTGHALVYSPWFVDQYAGGNANQSFGINLGAYHTDGTSPDPVANVTINGLILGGLGGANPANGQEDGGTSSHLIGGSGTGTITWKNLVLWDGTNHQANFLPTDNNKSSTFIMDSCRFAQGGFAGGGFVFYLTPSSTITVTNSTQDTACLYTRNSQSGTVPGAATYQGNVNYGWGGVGFLGSHAIGGSLPGTSITVDGCSAPAGAFDLADSVATNVVLKNCQVQKVDVGYATPADAMSIQVESSKIQWVEYVATANGTGGMTFRGCQFALPTDASQPNPYRAGQCSGNMRFENCFFFPGQYNENDGGQGGWISSSGAPSSSVLRLTLINCAYRQQYDNYNFIGNLRADEIVLWDFWAQEDLGASSDPDLIKSFNANNDGTTITANEKMSALATFLAGASKGGTVMTAKVNTGFGSQTAGNSLFLDAANRPKIGSACINAASPIGLRNDLSGSPHTVTDIGPWQRIP